MFKNNEDIALVLLKGIKEVSLYQKLVIQLNKDFQLAGLHNQFIKTISPTELVKNLHSLLFDLITKQFDDFLKLLYIIDVSENKIRAINQPDVKLLSEKVTYIILKREWQKVYFKNKFKD